MRSGEGGIEIAQLLAEGAATLEAHGVENAHRDAELLLQHCLGTTRTALYLHGDDRVENAICDEYRSLIQRRSDREPYAYIVSEQEFFSLPFYVDANVLIPRPETEFLLEKALSRVRSLQKPIDRCVDLCCGSGVIAVVLARELNAQVVALDLSEAAIDVTRKNASRLGVADLIEARVSDLFAEIGDEIRFPLIISNPPYVSSRDVAHNLEPEVSDYEPHLALDGGEDGLFCIRRIASQVLRHLMNGGLFFMEFGWDQAAAILQIFADEKYEGWSYGNLQILRDYGGKDRVLVAVAEKK